MLVAHHYCACRTLERGEEVIEEEEKEAVKLDPSTDFNFQSGCGRWQRKGGWERGTGLDGSWRVFERLS